MKKKKAVPEEKFKVDSQEALPKAISRPWQITKDMGSHSTLCSRTTASGKRTCKPTYIYDVSTRSW